MSRDDHRLDQPDYVDPTGGWPRLGDLLPLDDTGIVVAFQLSAVPVPVDVELHVLHAPTNDPAEAIYRLYWSDGVANDWTEEYDDLSVALCRLAVLVRAVRSEQFFTHQPADFTAAAEEFLTYQVD